MNGSNGNGNGSNGNGMQTSGNFNLADQNLLQFQKNNQGQDYNGNQEPTP